MGDEYISWMNYEYESLYGKQEIDDETYDMFMNEDI
jgi:hypothetical protein